MKTQYIKILSENGNELLFDKNCNLISEIEKSTNMKTLMSAEEWFKNLEDEFLYGNSKSELNKKCKTNYDLTYYAIKSYSTYLLNHHLEQFAEECKEKATFKGKYSFANRIEDIELNHKSIDQTLIDYKLKNNIK